MTCFKNHSQHSLKYSYSMNRLYINANRIHMVKKGGMCGRNRSVCDVSDPRFLCHVHKFINSALITVWHYQTAFQETVRSFLIVCLQLWILNMMILVQTWDIHSLWVIFAVLDSILLWQIFSHSHGGRQLSAVKIECRAQQVSWNVSGLRGLAE